MAYVVATVAGVILALGIVRLITSMIPTPSEAEARMLREHHQQQTRKAAAELHARAADVGRRSA